MNWALKHGVLRLSGESPLRITPLSVNAVANISNQSERCHGFALGRFRPLAACARGLGGACHANGKLLKRSNYASSCYFNSLFWKPPEALFHEYIGASALISDRQ